ncbi:MAG: hypothetical protein CMJ39_09145 [Phycisphaerae bacterium]|nr:hypothetical protein [Phycisphaerae bacterium]|tara:strand:+ start:277 stop:1038 length:762 start_codon:yes stop_codon:yes gene_type:complete
MKNDAYNKAITKFGPYMDPNTRSFCERVYASDQSVYESRLKAIGFNGLEHVLDAGCGVGQWTSVLAELNTSVSAFDIDGLRLAFLDSVLSADDKQADLRWSSITSLDYEDQSFDAIFSYGVIFISDWKKALEEFHRVLKPGGRLYFTINEIGWYLHLWNNAPNKESTYDPRQVAAEAFTKTIEYENRPEMVKPGSKIIGSQECTVELERLGFTNIQSGPEGTLSVVDIEGVRSFYPPTYEGLPGIREFLCVRP